MELKVMIDSLSDIGFSNEQKEMAKMYFESGQTSELVRYLKKCRCSLMDEMHESQRKVDRVDYLIWNAEKEVRVYQEECLMMHLKKNGRCLEKTYINGRDS